MKDIDFSSLVGETLQSIEGSKGDDRLVFTTESGKRLVMWHEQDCCESVAVEDVVGDMKDLIGSPILVAEESTSGKHPEGYEASEWEDSFTWTFYKLATIKGWVDIRWLGASNGYYSESVTFSEES